MGCKKEKLDEGNKLSITKVEVNFLSFLHELCWEGHKGVFKNCDELFTEKGHMFFVIIPKKGAENWYKEQMKKVDDSNIWKNEDVILEKINANGISNLSKDFNIWMFFTDIKYLKKTPEMDSSYISIIPRKIDMYFFNDKIKKWDVVDTFEIKNNKDESQENAWRQNNLDSIVRKSNKLLQNKNKKNQSIIEISQKWQGTYQRQFSEKFTDGTSSFWIYYFVVKNDKIVFTSDSEIAGKGSEYKGLERNNQLELVENETDTIEPIYFIKEEEGKYFIKGDSFENNNKWLLLEKKSD